jgi:hypothetical protein
LRLYCRSPQGSEQEKAIDIARLRAETGAVT